MHNFSGLKPGHVSLLAALCIQDDEASFLQTLHSELPEYRAGFTFLTGTPEELRKKLQRCILGCAFKNMVISKKESEIFSLLRASQQALNNALINGMEEGHIKLKVGMVSNGQWLSVALYGEIIYYPRLSHEVIGFGLTPRTFP
ncbi:HutP [Yersinia frederiksenii]|nr:HutP [Yersinia frederiksenii]CNK05252.1 HutP [Yersinia frederiksenii]